MKTLPTALGAAALVVTSLLAVPSAASAVDYPDCFDTTLVAHDDERLDKYVWFPSTNPRTLCDMGVWLGGKYNAGVEELQNALNACYLTGLTEDGRFGERTKAALQAVQKQIGVSPDGVYGPLTRNAMKWPARTGSGVGKGCDYGRNYRV
jgi:peptidoglycan hydrolase-like protein with peptidoglycan-binding domain